MRSVTVRDLLQATAHLIGDAVRAPDGRPRLTSAAQAVVKDYVVASRRTPWQFSTLVIENDVLAADLSRDSGTNVVLSFSHQLYTAATASQADRGHLGLISVQQRVPAT